MTTATIDMPGGFSSYFDGTGIAQGTDPDNAPEVVRLGEIWRSARVLRGGRTTRLTFELPADTKAVEELRAIAQDFLDTYTSAEVTEAERSGARTVWRRCNEALES